MKLLKKAGDLRYGWRGLRAVWREEWHFPYQIAALAGGFAILFLIDASNFELVLYGAFASIALGSEVINTVVEDLCNKIEPRFDTEIGKIKDMAQAFVILASLPVVVVFLSILVERL